MEAMWQRSVCPHDCPDACALLVRVNGQGQVEEVQGDPHHPFTQGILCGKVRHYERRIRHPHRLLVPLKRRGAKGEGVFEPISWEQALDEIAGRLTRIVEESGGEAILPYWYAGTMGLIQEQAGLPFFRSLGASELARTICSGAADAGWQAALPGAPGSDPEAVDHSDYVVIWGMNAADTNLHFFHRVRRAQARGARLVVVDPLRTPTARAAHWHVAPRPGTDGALALAIMHVLVSESLYDRDFVERFTTGFSRLRDHVLGKWPPERAESITGVPASHIRRLARELASARAPFLRIGVGISRHPNGAMTVRTLVSLAGLLGAFARPGGGCLLFTGRPPLHWERMERPDLLATPRPRQVNMVRLGEALTQLDPPVRALFVYSSNPANVAPDQTRVRRGLAREDLFTVVHEQFLTDTARYADLVLPATMMTEHTDLYRSYGQYYLMVGWAVSRPPGQAWSNWRLFRTLARRMGLSDPMFQRTEEELLPILVRRQSEGDPQGLTDEEWERLLRGEPVRVTLPAGTSNPLAAPDGRPRFRLRFSCPEWRAAGQEDLDYVPYRPLGLEEGEESGDEWLHLLPAPGHLFLNTSFQPLEDLRRREGGRPLVWLNPQDAQRRGLREGQAVVAANGVGSTRLWVRIREEVQPGTAVVPGLWDDAAHGGMPGVNALTSSALTDHGGAPTFYGTAVRLFPLPEGQTEEPSIPVYATHGDE
jgi:anaerobic selenocysteine-containing dehydrogenase